jgi:hypothetical protein
LFFGSCYVAGYATCYGHAYLKYDYRLIKDGDSIQVLDGESGAVIADGCATLKEALTYCAEEDPFICLGTYDAPLCLSSSPSGDSDNALISGIYFGYVSLTYADGGDGGLVIPGGASAGYRRRDGNDGIR